ncbi:hypothetical protein U3516DRAFT_844804 [Neocallimastix sp. 'constans']
MADTKSGYKRRFPRIGRCCCCFSPEMSVTVSSIILIVLLILCIIYSISFNIGMMDTTSIIIDYTVIVCVIISLIVLVIGVKKSKSSFMKQFRIVFLLDLVYEIYGIITYFIKVNSDEFIQETLKIMKDSYKTMNMENQLSEEMLINNIKRSFRVAMIEYIIISIIMIYYYLSTCSYIEDVKEKQFEEKDIRNLENNEY